ncbi:hypothetical protein FOZ60_010477 [Perkinsus olseni]|uniref:Uncharacterized protein n=1 Tax=Perkinsus olseni TaxID=32597 RepID=A0A7J6NF09_PEROL|nr:hypothetical protein FOZ60_010477 [Perkinsus olseni]
MADPNVIASLRRAFPVGAPEELRDAIVDSIAALGFSVADLPGLAKDVDMKGTIVNIVAPPPADPAQETPMQATLRAARSFKIRLLMEQAGNPTQKSKCTVAEFLAKAEHRFGTLSPDMTPDEVRRETVVDKDGSHQKQAIGLDGKPVWVMTGSGKEPQSFEELVSALTPILVGVEVLSGTTLSVTTNYINKLTVLCAGHGPAATIQYDKAFRQRLVVNSAKHANKTGKSYSESVAECLCNGKDDELLVKAYASGFGGPSSRSAEEANSKDLTSLSDGGHSRNRRRPNDESQPGAKSSASRGKRRGGPNEWCPYAKEDCKLLKLKSCPFVPRRHRSNADGGKKQKSG